MAEAFIVEAARTAGGRRNGRLSGWHPVDLGALALNAIVERTGIDPAAIEDVIMGCVGQAGEQGLHIGRNAVLASKLPESVPAVSAVLSGSQDVVLAAGVESMSRVPMGTTGTWTAELTPGSPMSQGLLDRYPGIIFSQFEGAELIARKHGFSRADLDAFALESHRRAATATQAGAFDREIIPVPIETPEGSELHVRDEGIRYDASLESIGSVKLIKEGGVISAASSSQICDGSSAVLVVSEQALKVHNLTPIARIHGLTVTAGDPVVMLEEPLFATERALKRAGLRIDDIDLYEVNEAFAPVPLAWLKHLGADPAKLNVNGGAIALGHPLGASGAKLMATLIHALKARGKKYGLQTMCEGGGVANVTIVEAL